MKVTEISKPIKHISKVSFDNGESVSLYADYISEISLSVGQEISEEYLEEIRVISEEKRAFSRACYYLADADYSEKGMVKKLRRASFPDFAAEAAAARLVELGYIDDRKFAAHLAERYNLSGVSNREAFYKMSEKGLSREDIREALDCFDSDETEKILSLINSKYANKLTDNDSAKKVFAALMRKGFNSSDIRSAMRKFLEE